MGFGDGKEMQGSFGSSFEYITSQETFNLDEAGGGKRRQQKKRGGAQKCAWNCRKSMNIGAHLAKLEFLRQ